MIRSYAKTFWPGCLLLALAVFGVVIGFGPASFRADAHGAPELWADVSVLCILGGLAGAFLAAMTSPHSLRDVVKRSPLKVWAAPTDDGRVAVWVRGGGNERRLCQTFGHDQDEAALDLMRELRSTDNATAEARRAAKMLNKVSAR